MSAVRCRSSSAFTIVELLVVIAIIGVLVALLLPAVQAARESSRRVKCQNNMRQIGLAFHNHESSQRVLPPGWTDSGAARSYIPDLLPYFEQMNLLSKYDLSKSWSHAANKAAADTNISFLICPSAPKAPRIGVNDYPVSDTIGTPAKTNLGLPSAATGNAIQSVFVGSGKPTRLSEVTDGLSNTFLLFEDAGRPQPWLRGKLVHGPAGNILIGNEKWADPANRITIQVWCGSVINCHNGNEIYSFHPGGTNYVMGDGALRFVHQTIASATFVALYTRAGGETVTGAW